MSPIRPSATDTFVTRQQQARRYGPTSVKTIVRWGRDPRMAMPPEYEFGGRFFRKLSDLEAWERGRVGFPRGAQAPGLVEGAARP